MKYLHQFVLIILLISGGTCKAQYYAIGDTSYEYSLKGTVYANLFEGRKTSSGEVFHQSLYTGAHWKIKLGTLIQVTCPETGKQVIVKINDRCPTKGVLDLTRQAANDLGIKGVKKVIVKQLPDSYREQWENQKGSISVDIPTPQKEVKTAQSSKSKTATKVTRPKRTEDDEDEPQF